MQVKNEYTRRAESLFQQNRRTCAFLVMRYMESSTLMTSHLNWSVLEESFKLDVLKISCTGWNWRQKWMNEPLNPQRNISTIFDDTQDEEMCSLIWKQLVVVGSAAVGALTETPKLDQPPPPPPPPPLMAPPMYLLQSPDSGCKEATLQQQWSRWNSSNPVSFDSYWQSAMRSCLWSLRLPTNLYVCVAVQGSGGWRGLLCLNKAVFFAARQRGNSTFTVAPRDSCTLVLSFQKLQRQMLQWVFEIQMRAVSTEIENGWIASNRSRETKWRRWNSYWD